VGLPRNGQSSHFKSVSAERVSVNLMQKHDGGNVPEEFDVT
jgi:hypothetical protein